MPDWIRFPAWVPGRGQWSRRVPIAAGLAAAGAFLLFLHASGLVPLAWQSRALAPDRMVPDGGHAVRVALGIDWMDDASTPAPSPAVVLEDGTALPLPRAGAASVRSHGYGRYAIADGTLYLSSTDGTDVRDNGHGYALRWPAPVPGWLRFPAYGAGLAGVAALLWPRRRRLLAFAAGPGALWAGLGLILLAALVTRLPFYWQYAVPGVTFDSITYLMPVYDAEAGRLPMFGLRTAGYPLFLMAMGLLSHEIMPVMVAQSVLSVGGFGLLTYAVHRTAPALTLPAALVLAGVACLPEHLVYETAILSDSLFASTVLLASACLLLGFGRRSAPWLGAASAAMGWAILVRPAGLFYVVIFALGLAFLFLNRHPWPARAAFALPFVAILAGAAGYNAATRGSFTLTTAGGPNLAAATAIFWEPDPAFGPEVNRVIGDVAASFPEADRQEIRRSRDIVRLHALFEANYGWARHVRRYLPDDRRWDVTWDRRLRRIALHAVREHPDLYAKFVLSMGWAFFLDNIRHDMNPYDGYTGRLYESFLGRYYDLDARTIERRGEPLVVVKRAYGEFYRNTPDGFEAIRVDDRVGHRLVYHPLTKPHQLLMHWTGGVLRHTVWVYAFFLTAIASGVVFVASRGRDGVAFGLVLLCATGIGAGLLVCLSEEALPRYSLPVWFVFFLAPVLAPLLRLPRKAAETAAAEGEEACGT